MAGYNLYGYEPNQALAAVALAIYFTSIAILTFLNIKYKKYFFFLLTGAGLADCIGFALRIYSKGREDELTLYIVSSLFILLPPTIAAAAGYTLLGRIMTLSKISHPIFTPKFAQWAFLIVDIVSFIIQLGGGGMMATQSTANVGRYMMIFGLALALACFCFFEFLCFYIVYRARKQTNGPTPKWQYMFIALIVTVLLFIIRSVYRLAEFAPGYHSALAINETYFYVLDVIPIGLVFIMWIPFHPGFYLNDDAIAKMEAENAKSEQPSEEC